MSKYVLSILCVGLLFTACEKTDIQDVEIVSNDALELRSELQEDGYIETISDSIVKEECYFEEWDKTVLTPVSGLIEFHDENDNWVASIDFGGR
jgi:alpha-D-ribose 1-methylphosphonate 5-triphosphate diphosphatase PhnM